MIESRHIVLQIGSAPCFRLIYIGCLQAACSLDSEGRLVFEGRFTPRQREIELLVKNYLIDYVQCRMCKGFNTNLVKDSAARLTFIECNRCQVLSVSRSKFLFSELPSTCLADRYHFMSVVLVLLTLVVLAGAYVSLPVLERLPRHQLVRHPTHHTILDDNGSSS
jgi:hypothetical protein